jgi:hypothetical protein
VTSPSTSGVANLTPACTALAAGAPAANNDDLRARCTDARFLDRGAQRSPFTAGLLFLALCSKKRQKRTNMRQHIGMNIVNKDMMILFETSAGLFVLLWPRLSSRPPLWRASPELPLEPARAHTSMRGSDGAPSCQLSTGRPTSC